MKTIDNFPLRIDKEQIMSENLDPQIEQCENCRLPIGEGCCEACIAYACASAADHLDDDREEPRCEHCGKAPHDFSDFGCGRCDARTPEFGIES